jgi:hypothetical protein
MTSEPFLSPQPVRVKEPPKPSRYSRYANGGTWEPFYLGAPIAPPDVELKTSDSTRLVISLHCHGMWRTTINFNGIIYDNLEIPSTGHTRDIGKPALPLITRLVQVPRAVDLTGEILHSQYIELNNLNVTPAQVIPSPEPNMTLPVFTIDQTTYNTDAFYPTSIAWIVGGNTTSTMIIRGHRVVSLSFAPVQFNPVTNISRVYSQIEVALNYNQPARLEPIDSRLESPVFEEMLQGLMLNYPRSGGAHHLLPLRARQIPTEGCEYLIITPDDPGIVAEFSKLAQWKTQKGITTRIVTTSDIVQTRTDLPYIRESMFSYIRDGYHGWTLAPTYVLLVGDEDTMPTRYGPEGWLDPFENPTTPNLASDLWYFTVDGDDYIPDILYGRISVDTASQAETIVKKILNYEQQGITDPEFYKICGSAYFEDGYVWQDYWNPDGIEDPHMRLVDTAENLWWFFDGGRTIPRYPVDYIYCKNHVPPYPSKFEDGTELHERLQSPSYWDDLLKTQALIDAINGEGRFLVFNLGHGESRNKNFPGIYYRGTFDGWQSPYFDTDKFIDLANGAKLPVVWSMDCNCGWFDGETDFENQPLAAKAYESFSEEITRMAGGAVAAIGATRRSPSLGSVSLIYGMVDAIWDDFDNTMGSGGIESLGSVLWYGKMYALREWGYAGGEVPTPLGDLPLLTYGLSQGTFELYHLFGDPEMPLWTAVPQELEVTYPLEIGTSAVQSFGVKVTLKGNPNEPINFARVCLLKEDDVYEVAYTDSRGFAVFSIDPQSVGQMSVTVTAPGYLPNYNGIITVTRSDGATLTLKTYEGIAGVPIEIHGNGFGSTVWLMRYTHSHPDIEFYEYLPITTDNGEFTVYWDVVAGDEPLTFIAKDEDDPYRISVVCFIRLVDKPDPYMYYHGDDTTWHLNPGSENPCWDNPCIRIWHESGALYEPRLDNPMIEDKRYIFEADIYNAGPATIPKGSLNVVFLWAKFQVGTPSWHHCDIAQNEEAIPPPDEYGEESFVSVRLSWKCTKTMLPCIRVRIKPQEDTRWKNNHGWENFAEFFVESTELIRQPSRSILGDPLLLTLNESMDSASTVFVEGTQMSGFDTLWNFSLDRSHQPKLALGESEDIMANFAVPGTVPFDGTQNFSINSYVGQYLIGGAQIRVRKIVPTTITTIVLLIGGGATFLVVLVIIIILIRRRTK